MCKPSLEPNLVLDKTGLDFFRIENRKGQNSPVYWQYLSVSLKEKKPLPHDWKRL